MDHLKTSGAEEKVSAILSWTDNVFLVSAPNTSIPSSTAAMFDL